MDEYGLVGFERSHDHDKLPGGKVIHWNCGALECRQSGRSREDLLQRHANHVGISAHAPHDVGEIDPARLDAYADLSRVLRRICGFFNSQYFWRPGACNPNLSHDNNSLLWRTSIYGPHLNLNIIRKAAIFEPACR